MYSTNTPEKIVKKRGRPLKYTTVDDVQNSCRVCKCLFRVQYGNDEKIKQISTENIFEPTMRKGIENKSTLIDMCFQMGLIIEANERLSKRVCKPCGRKIRKARSQTIKKTSTASQKARKALDYDEIENETRNDDAIMSALNIDEICNTEKKETQLKTIIVHPNGNIET